MEQDFYSVISAQNQQERLKTNEYTCNFGLSLTKQDVAELMSLRKECLME